MAGIINIITNVPLQKTASAHLLIVTIIPETCRLAISSSRAMASSVRSRYFIDIMAGSSGSANVVEIKSIS